MPIVQHTLRIVALTALFVAPTIAHAQLFNANNPAQTGYTLTFADDFGSPHTIDVNATAQPGFKWYTKAFFGGSATPPNALSVHGHVLTVGVPDTQSQNTSVATACPAPTAQGWVGTVFGGGAYFEASIAFDPAKIDTKQGWPAFWAMGIEHMALKGLSQWEGQPAGQEHFIEDDFFEYDTAGFAGKNSYGGAVHDWSGGWTKEKGFPGNVQNKNFVIHVPDGTDFNKFHRFGNLWIPASPANAMRGSIQYFFDGLPTADIVTWDGTTLPCPPPLGEGSLFAIADKQHLVVILGCGQGQNMRVRDVHVWQPKTGTAVH